MSGFDTVSQVEFFFFSEVNLLEGNKDHLKKPQKIAHTHQP